MPRIVTIVHAAVPKAIQCRRRQAASERDMRTIEVETVLLGLILCSDLVEVDGRPVPDEMRMACVWMLFDDDRQNVLFTTPSLARPPYHSQQGWGPSNPCHDKKQRINNNLTASTSSRLRHAHCLGILSSANSPG
jgi:hypothetical protein